MSDLIVDFPTRSRSLSFCGSNTSHHPSSSPSSSSTSTEDDDGSITNGITATTAVTDGSSDGVTTVLATNNCGARRRRQSTGSIVHFAQTVDIQFFASPFFIDPRDDSNDRSTRSASRSNDNSRSMKKKLWYSEQEYKAMKVRNRRAVCDAHQRFRGKTSETTSNTETTSNNDSENVASQEERGAPRSMTSRSTSSSSTSPSDQPLPRTPANNVEYINEDASILTGLERLLTSKIIKKSQACRIACRNAILDEQERQDASGSFNEMELARAAMAKSEWARKRAHTIGLLNASTEED